MGRLSTRNLPPPFFCSHNPPDRGMYGMGGDPVGCHFLGKKIFLTMYYMAYPVCNVIKNGLYDVPC